MKRFVLCLVAALSACRGEAPRPPPPAALAVEEPVDARELLALTRSIAKSERGVFSLLISKNDHLVYELYTSHLVAIRLRTRVDDETGYFDNIMRGYVRPAMSGARASNDDLRQLKTELEALRTSRPRFDGVEPRLIPSIAPKETHHAFRP